MAVACYEPFSDWLEEKIDLPIFEELPGLESRCYGHNFRDTSKSFPVVTQVSVMTIPSVIPATAEAKSLPVPQAVVLQDTQSLLREFETVFGEVELTNGTLTPPQSPPVPPYTSVASKDPKEGELIILQQMIPVQPIPAAPMIPVIYNGERKETLFTLEQMVPGTPSPDLARELEAVDELVRTRVEHLVDIGSSHCIPDPWESCSSGNNSGSSLGGESEGEASVVAPPSPCTSSSGSSCGSGEETCDDPEWIPALIQVPPSDCLKNARKRAGSTKPYSRPGIEEKRMRKKEQNKNAATRYRQKKKAEIEEILGEEKGLEDMNAELQLKASDLSREIKYLKGLMRDLFKAKGLIK
ncbi:activating transcription factor of chaperone isoform X2 [Zootermopsis nevadensis]|uniref:activating transcription factor of chaperone isoform X2 n=1 Tax=Zootermopsis nevadensis TaxID=136037 RepID=UPI000B8EB3AE|nr:activating transcription factor of chaperone isoform X2 [Zootermopsis nevadensis]